MLPKTAVYPGSFDPITYGHINIVERARKRFEKLYVLVTNNSQKKYLFSLEERIELTKTCLKKYDNVEVISYEGLVVDYAKAENIYTVVRGLRAVSDFEYEFQMASANRALFPELEIMFLMTDTAYSFISSSVVREVAKYGGKINCWVPKSVEEKLISKFKDI
jgi:pantetheine-phosphate adenylyltransferase